MQLPKPYKGKWRKFLRNTYFVQKFKPDHSDLHISQLPDPPIYFIANHPNYTENKDSFLHKGPRLWVFQKIWENQPIHAKSLYNMYLNDKIA